MTRPGRTLAAARAARLLSLMALPLFALGCGEAESADLVVATTWPAAECERIDAEFPEWLAGTGEAHARPPKIRWIDIDADTSPAVIGRLRPRPDLVLGGLAAILIGGEATAADRRLAVRSPAPRPAAEPDPRRSPRALNLAQSWIATDGFAPAYRRFGEWCLRPDPQGIDDGDTNADFEMAAALPADDHDDLAASFLRFLAANRGSIAKVEPVDPGLLADLIGSTILDAREEWIAASRALGEDEAARSRLFAPPPWPPDSILRFRSRPDGAELLAQLTAELAADADSQLWLDRAWDEPGVVDADRLNAIATAAGRRLAVHAPFRTWLRAEWTDWARRRADAIAREARMGAK